mgnify:CR=1 FL=1
MTNKYAEGYPGKRYYGGCEWVDVAETLAIERAKKLFGAQFRQRAAELRQPDEPGGVSGAAAARRHLHGPRSRRRRPSHPRLAGQHVRQVVQGAALHACAARTRSSTWTRSPRSAEEVKPKLIIAGGSAYSRAWDFKRFREIADSVGAYLHGRHGAFRRPRRRRRACLAGAACACHHHHHAQVAARPARRLDPVRTTRRSPRRSTRRSSRACRAAR